MDALLVAIGIIGERQLTDELLNEVLGMLPQIKRDIDPSELDRVRRQLEASIGISVSAGQGLHGGDIAPWVADVKATIRWDYWDAYVKQLRSKGLGQSVVRVLDEDTDNILTECGNPNEGGPWKAKGLVMGDVQSGKTANYCGLISKAADAGYKVIVLLTGMIEELRAQSQERLDEGFVGRDSRELLETTQSGRPVGAGRFRVTLDANGVPVSKAPNVLTSVDSDFLRNNQRALGGIPLRNIREPVLLVMKKNKSPLDNLIGYVDSQIPHGATRLDLPLLVIDDEADNASVNARKDDDPAAINRLIRELLKRFSRVSYVGYTATPFANVFINPDIDEELFPSNFVYSLSAPSNYLGVSSFFAPSGSHAHCVMEITDAEPLLPYNHKRTRELTDIPDSLRDALGVFLLSCAVRDLRQEPLRHRTMLVNASRFTAVQQRIANLLKSELYDLTEDVKQYLASGRWESYPRLQGLRDLWNEHYSDSGATWDEIRTVLHESISAIAVVTVNQESEATERLNYSRYAGSRFGRRVIAVGGLTLSRGLTLEGLCVSYFYRNSKAYDTLLQMGRWFGYRPGYDDLCRVWLDPLAWGWYAHLADVVGELRSDIRWMHANRMPPSKFGMRVRSHPGALIVTAMAKMRNANEVPITLSYSAFGAETPLLPDDERRNSENVKEVSSFVAELGPGEWIGERPVWKGVKKQRIAAFLERLHILDVNVHFMHDMTGRSRPLTDFIAQNALPELDEWDVCLPQGDGKPLSLLSVTRKDGSGAVAARPRERQFEWVPKGSGFLRLNRQRVGDAADEQVGLDAPMRARAREEWNAERERDSTLGESVPAYFYRRYRARPLLTIHVIEPVERPPREEQGTNKRRKRMMGVGEIEPKTLLAVSVSFPQFKGESGTTSVVYALNRVALRSAGLISDDDEDDED
jgi:hypothetical protein